MEEKRSRHRLPISCVQCRRRKRKCDRQNPCHTCLHRGEADQCTYESPAESSHTDRLEDVRSDNYALRQRVRRLEEMVRHYGQNHIESHGLATPELDQRFRHRGSLEGQTPGSLLGSGSLCSPLQHHAPPRYKSQTSWDHILKHLDELKLALTDSGIDEAFAFEDATLAEFREDKDLFAAGPQQNFANLYAFLPPKPQMDALLSQYLNSYHPFNPIINPLDFKRQYQSFLSDPGDAVVLSLLFGMMALALVNHDSKDRLADDYIRFSLQALHLSQFVTNFNLTTVVCLINIMSFLQRERGKQTFSWVIFGTTMQIARSLGLHRDPPHFQIIGQDCQTRRHIWVALLAQDAIHAARYGQTTLIDMDEWDSKAPEQVDDEGIRIYDPIPTAYAHAKRQIAMSIGRLFKSLFAPRTRPSYQTVLDVDLDIRNSHNSLVQFAADDQQTSRANLQAVHWLYGKYSSFLKAYTLIVIHRPFLVRKTSDFFHSRITCLESARTLLSIVSEMAARTGMDHYRWYIREHQNLAYLPAATLLCIGLHIKQNPSFEALPQQMDQVEEASDRQMIEDVIERLPDESDASKIVRSLYDQVSPRRHTKEDMDRSALIEHDQVAVSDSTKTAPYWDDNGAHNPLQSDSWSSSSAIPLADSMQQNSFLPFTSGQAQTPDQDAMLSQFNSRWSQIADNHASQSRHHEQNLRNLDPTSSYWTNGRPD